MATFSKGILGGFSGTVGTVVGGNWRGIDYMRSKAVFRNSNPSTAQEVQRAKFLRAIKFLQSMSDLFEIGFRGSADKMTATNSALSYTLKNAISGVYPNFHIDYSLVLVTKGGLPNATAPAAAPGTAGKIQFNWTNNSGKGKAKAGDKAILVAYCEDLDQVVYTVDGILRSAGSGILDVPAFSGKDVQTWLSFISENGKEVATSINTGEWLVA